MSVGLNTYVFIIPCFLDLIQEDQYMHLLFQMETLHILLQMESFNILFQMNNGFYDAMALQSHL